MEIKNKQPTDTHTKSSSTDSSSTVPDHLKNNMDGKVRSISQRVLICQQFSVLLSYDCV